MRRQPGERGYTLLEIVVYIAIFVFISVSTVQTLILINHSLNQVRAVRALNAAAGIAMERMVRTIRDAASVDTGSSVFGSSPGTLVFIGSESPGIIYTVSVSGGGLKLNSGGTDLILTPPGVIVTNLVFRNIVASTTSQAVKIEMTIAASSGGATTTENLYDTVILRNSYAQ